MPTKIYIYGSCSISIQPGYRNDYFFEEISEYMPLNEGDIILTGTPLGRVDLQHGDVVRIEVDQLGAVENTIQEQGV